MRQAGARRHFGKLACAARASPAWRALHTSSGPAGRIASAWNRITDPLSMWSIVPVSVCFHLSPCFHSSDFAIMASRTAGCSWISRMVASIALTVTTL